MEAAIGKKCIIRGKSSGVYVGTVMKAEATNNASETYTLEVHNIQRVWSWSGALETITVAANGITGGRISPALDVGIVCDAREVWPMSDEAKASFDEVGVWTR